MLPFLFAGGILIQSVCILGLGDTGYSCLRFLKSQSILVNVMDSRKHPPHLEDVRADYPEVSIHLGSWDLPTLLKASVVVISPGLSLEDPVLQQAKAQGVKFWSDIELFSHYVQVPVIGITGTNGKTTVTTLVGALLRGAGYAVATGGNLGPAACDLLTINDLDMIVLELSSFQLEHTYSLQLKAAAILNCSEDHMDRYGCFKDYVAAKQRIYQRAEHAVYSVEDQNTKPNHLSRLTSFAINHSADFSYKEGALRFQEQTIMSEADLALKGAGRIENALAACALTLDWVKDPEVWKKTLLHFKGLEHRCEPVFTKQAVTWYNDSKGTNLGAMLTALEYVCRLHDKTLLLLGGVNKGASFEDVADFVMQKAQGVIAYGRDGRAIAHALGSEADVQVVSTLEDAVILAKSQVSHGALDAVLFSPACASFDAFDNFAHRGRVFKELIAQEAD